MSPLTEGLQGQTAKQGVKQFVCFSPDRLGDTLSFKRAFSLAPALLRGDTGTVDQQHILLGGIQYFKNRDFFRFARQCIASLRSTLAFEKPGTFQVLK